LKIDNAITLQTFFNAKQMNSSYKEYLLLYILNLAYAKWLKCTDRTISESLVSRFEVHMECGHI